MTDGIKESISSNLKEEKKSLDVRFENANKIFNKNHTKKPEQLSIKRTFTIYKEDDNRIESIRLKLASQESIMATRSQVIRSALKLLDSVNNYDDLKEYFEE